MSVVSVNSSNKVEVPQFRLLEDFSISQKDGSTKVIPSGSIFIGIIKGNHLHTANGVIIPLSILEVKNFAALGVGDPVLEKINHANAAAPEKLKIITKEFSALSLSKKEKQTRTYITASITGALIGMAVAFKRQDGYMYRWLAGGAIAGVAVAAWINSKNKDLKPSIKES